MDDEYKSIVDSTGDTQCSGKVRVGDVDRLDPLETEWLALTADGNSDELDETEINFKQFEGKLVIDDDESDCRQLTVGDEDTNSSQSSRTAEKFEIVDITSKIGAMYDFQHDKQKETAPVPKECAEGFILIGATTEKSEILSASQVDSIDDLSNRTSDKIKILTGQNTIDAQQKLTEKPSGSTENYIESPNVVTSIDTIISDQSCPRIVNVATVPRIFEEELPECSNIKNEKVCVNLGNLTEGLGLNSAMEGACENIKKSTAANLELIQGQLAKGVSTDLTGNNIVNTQLIGGEEVNYGKPSYDLSGKILELTEKGNFIIDDISEQCVTLPTTDVVMNLGAIGESVNSLNDTENSQSDAVTKTSLQLDLTDRSRLDADEINGKLSRSDTGNTCILIVDQMEREKINSGSQNKDGGKSLLSTPTEEPRNKSPVTIQEWVDSLPVQEPVVRKEDETPEEVEANDWEVENLTLGAEAAIVCPPEPCPAVQITGCLGGSDAGSHCSSMESFLEARKPDPEELLLELGFGGPPTQNDNISRIPARFLQPSHLKGVDIERFLKQQQEMADTIQSSFNGYRGLTGRQHERPSVIVGKIMERLREAENAGNRARRGSTAQPGPHSATDASPKLATVARNLLNRLRVVRAEGSVLNADNRAWLEAQGDRSPEPKNKKLIIGKQSFTFTNDGRDLIPCKSRSPSRSPSSNRLSPRNGGSEERLTPSPNRLSPRNGGSEGRLTPSPNRLSPRDASRSDDHLSISPNRLSLKTDSNLHFKRLSPQNSRKVSGELLNNMNNRSAVNNNSDNLLNIGFTELNFNIEKKQSYSSNLSEPIQIPSKANLNDGISRHFASLCNVHKPLPRRRSAGSSDHGPTSMMERKTSEPLVKSCGCRCHPVSSSAPASESPRSSTPSSTQDHQASFKRHAYNTENYLYEKNIFNADVLKRAVSTLWDEVKPVDELPQYSSGYRKLLATGLFYRSILSLAGNRADQKFRSGAYNLVRPISSGKHVFQSDKTEYPLTQPIPKLEALIQCEGEAKYVNDFEKLSEELVGCLVLAKPKQFADIEQIDPSQALKMPGVVAFYSATDIPGQNEIAYPFAIIFGPGPVPLFADRTLNYWGQPVGIIVATTQDIAENAADKVVIKYKTDNPPKTPLLSIRDVLNSPEKDKRVKLIPDSKSVQACEDLKAEGTDFDGEIDVTKMGQYSHTTEPPTCRVIPIEDGQFEVLVATQSITATKLVISQVMNIANNKIDCKVPRVGGSFGSKNTSQLHGVCGCTLAASKLQRPVRMVMRVEDEMLATGKRAPFYATYKGKCDNTGKIQLLNLEVYIDYGFSTQMNIAIPVRGSLKNYFDDSKWKICRYQVITDKAPMVILRGPGFVESMAIIEQIMDHVAFVSKVSPIDVRVNNAGDNEILPYLKDWSQQTDFNNRKTNIDKFNSENRWKKKGIALTAMKYGFEYTVNQVGCTVGILYPDGTVQVQHGGIEMGQGLNTKVAQAVAHELELPLNMIQMKPTTSLNCPNNTPTWTSIGSEIAVLSAVQCCQQLKCNLKPVREKLKNPTWQQVVAEAFNCRISLSVNEPVGEFKGDFGTYSVYGSAVTETEVDLLTGQHQVTRVDLLEDVGKSMSPDVDLGQIEGGFVMSLGLHTTERLVYDPKNGQLVTNRLWNYYAPRALDIPIDYRITFKPNSTNKHGVYDSKSTGEPAVALGISVINSLRYALMSARTDAGLPSAWIPMASPSTPETILLASGTSKEQFVL